MHQIRQNARPTIRERREKREPRSERERDDRADERRDRRSRRSSDDRTAPTSGAVHDRDRRSSGAIAIVDRAARRTSVLPDLMHFLVKRLNEPNTKINFP